jgi:hypothetical protein
VECPYARRVWSRRASGDAPGLPERLGFHDVRHSAATLLLAQGVPQRVVMEQLGHTTLAMTQLYMHVVPQLMTRPRGWTARSAHDLGGSRGGDPRHRGQSLGAALDQPDRAPVNPQVSTMPGPGFPQNEEGTPGRGLWVTWLVRPVEVQHYLAR